MSNKNEELASYLIVLIKAMFLVICVFCIEKWQKVTFTPKTGLRNDFASTLEDLNLL